MIEVEVKARFDHDRAQDILDLLGIYKLGVERIADFYLVCVQRSVSFNRLQKSHGDKCAMH